MKQTLKVLEYMAISKESALTFKSVTFNQFEYDPELLHPKLVMTEKFPLSILKDINSEKEMFKILVSEFYSDPMIINDRHYLMYVRKAFDANKLLMAKDFWADFVKKLLNYGFADLLCKKNKNELCQYTDTIAGILSLLVKSLFAYNEKKSKKPVSRLFDEIADYLVISIRNQRNYKVLPIYKRFLESFCLELRRPFYNDESVEFPDYRHEAEHTRDSQRENVLAAAFDLLDGSMDPEISFVHLVSYFGALLHSIRPDVLPKFGLLWLEIVSSNGVFPTLCSAEQGRTTCCTLIADIIGFMTIIAKSSRSSEPRKLYFERGIYILTHIRELYPHMLCEYYQLYIDIIPINCVQLRNIILSSHPLIDKDIPNPYLTTLESVRELERNDPIIGYNSSIHIAPKEFRLQLIAFLKTGGNILIPDKLIEAIYTSERQSKFSINRLLLNATVQLLALVSVEMLAKRGLAISVQNVQTLPSFYLFTYLLLKMDRNGLFLLINAAVNNLRYPNSHTRFFKCLLISVIENINEAQKRCDSRQKKSDHVIELILRTLLERVCSYVPHPWGAVSVVAELVRDPKYELKQKGFVKKYPQLTHIFATLEGNFKKVLDEEKGNF